MVTFKHNGTLLIIDLFIFNLFFCHLRLFELPLLSAVARVCIFCEFCLCVVFSQHVCESVA